MRASSIVGLLFAAVVLATISGLAAGDTARRGVKR